MKYLIHDILEYEIIELRLNRKVGKKTNGDNHMYLNNFKNFLHR